MLFWSLAFPILLAIFFYMGFYNLSRGEIIKTIPVAVVENVASTEDLLQIMESARIDEDNPLFQMIRVNQTEAETLLQERQVEGIVFTGEETVLAINSNGYYQTIIKAFLDTYLQSKQTAIRAGGLNQEMLNEDLFETAAGNRNYIIDGNSSDNLDTTLIYFYTLIALACMFGSNYGFREMRDIEANQSPVAARLQVTPVNKFKLLLCNLAASFTIHFLSILLLLFFLSKVLMIEFGGETLRLISICFLGSICGIAFGAMVCVIVKANIKVRSAILYIVVLGGSFLSGMLIVDMKYFITNNIPLLGFINPSNLITDAFYSLYFYDGYDRYQLNLSILGVLTGIFIAITYFEVRRKDYASI
jgi:ABC-2 type transport system permease protein